MKLENKSINQLKKHLWILFSPLIRQRGMDENGFNICVTCGRDKHWKNGDAGHFIAGRRNYTYFDPRAVWFQCKPCNGGFNNSAPKDIPRRYKNFMIQKIGKKSVEEMIKKNRKPMQFDKITLIKLILAAQNGYEEYEKTYFEVIPNFLI